MRRGAFALVCLVGFAGLFSALTFCSAAAGQAPQYPRATYPGKDWSLEFQLPGFVVQTSQMVRNDTQYIQAENLTDEVWVAISLEKLREGDPSQKCAVWLDRQVKYLTEQVKVDDVSATEMNSIPVREFMLHSFMGRKVEQKRLIGCMTKDDIFAGVEVWKLEYQPADEHFLLDSMNSLQVVKAEKKGFTVSGAAPTDSGVARDLRGAATSGAGQTAGIAQVGGQIGAQAGNEKTSAYYFALGTQYYVNRDYTGAIRQYQKSFDLEKENRQLSRSFWIALVDNLGTAYAEEKYLDRAEEVFKYGVSKERIIRSSTTTSAASTRCAET
jgi:hypothetical protein